MQPKTAPTVEAPTVRGATIPLGAVDHNAGSSLLSKGAEAITATDDGSIGTASPPPPAAANNAAPAPAADDASPITSL